MFKIFIIVFSLFSWVFQPIQAQTVPPLHTIEIIAPKEVFVDEAFDVTVRILDVSGKKIETYEWEIYFDVLSTTDTVIPGWEDGYTFKLNDKWEHTFQKGFTIKKIGKHFIEVYSLDGDDDSEFKTEIVVKPKTETKPVKVDIAITEPVTNTTVSTKEVLLVGTTKPTSSVNIKHDGIKIITTQSDANGNFTANIPNLKPNDNTLIAEVMDGTGTLVGTSEPVIVKHSTEVPKLTSLKVLEGDEFFIKSTITFLGEWDKNLKIVQLSIGDKTVLLEEDKNKLWTYSGKFQTSEFEGEFNVTANLESQLWTKAVQKDMTKFRTVAAEIKNVKIEVDVTKKVQFTWELTPDLAKVNYFKIRYGTESKNYKEEVVTLIKSEIKKDNTFTWYIPNIPPGFYYSTIIALDTKKDETYINSGEQTFEIKLDAAPTCTIEKISGLRVERSADGTYSMLTWDNQANAIKYEVWKKDNGGDFILFDEVTTNSIRINLDTSATRTTYADFRVRGICYDGTFWDAFSESVAVPTGPEMIIFFALFLSSGIAYILIRRGYLN